MRHFGKPAITVSEQLDLLRKRGMLIQDESEAHRFLEFVSFFRLTPYMRPFQVADDAAHGFHSGVTFSNLTCLYEFDRRLRLLVIDAIERIEVAMRALITNHMGPRYGPHWYLESTFFHHEYRHNALLDSIKRKQNDARRDYERECHRIDRSNAHEARKYQLKKMRSAESYARHYGLTYFEPDLMPAWAVMEETTFGELSYLFKGLARDSDKKAVARHLALPGPLLQSWLHSLTAVRNICAHHGRLWNRELGVRPELPKTISFLWPQHLRQTKPHARVFPVLCILTLLMRYISPQAGWDRRLHRLISEHPEIKLLSMGFPCDWYQDPFWHVESEAH